LNERDDFLESILPRVTEADKAFHNGDPKPRLTLWSENDPVTLFGAALTATGRKETASAFEWLAEGFSNCEGFEYEVIAAHASGDLAYIVGIEHTTASVRGAPPEPYALRVTTIFRREHGEWKIAHRHGDPVPESVSARDQLNRMVGEDGEA
jgi:ketosteroid isomerase-like protein